MATLKPLGKREQKKFQDATIRRCSSECFYFKNGGSGCQYYQQGDCSHGETCMHDLVRIKAYADAFVTGNTDVVKDDSSRITALVMMQVESMLQQVLADGATVNEPIVDAKGAVVYIPDPDWDRESGEERIMIPAMRMKEHPLISRAIQLAKGIGINLSEFKLTPKSADEKAQVSGHLIVDEKLSIEDLMKKRTEIEDRFMAAVEKGAQMTLNDPVYQKLREDGDIVDG